MWQALLGPLADLIGGHLERKAEEARQRGGRMSFGFGGVRLTLPEFGISEMLEIN